MNADIISKVSEYAKSWQHRFANGTDLLQSTMEKMLEGEKKGVVIHNLKGWASSVFRNLAVDNYREESRFVLSEETVLLTPDEEKYPEYIEDSIDKRSAYRLMMAVLPRDEKGQQLRKVLHLTAEGLSIKEIAKSLKVSKPCVEGKLEKLAQFIEFIEKASLRGSGILSERQRLILMYIKREKMGKDIARLLHISEALVSKDLEAIRKILSECENGPWNDGGGGGVSQFHHRARNSRAYGHGSPNKTQPVVRALLCLPAFQELHTTTLPIGKGDDPRTYSFSSIAGRRRGVTVPGSDCGAAATASAAVGTRGSTWVGKVKGRSRSVFCDDGNRNSDSGVWGIHPSPGEAERWCARMSSLHSVGSAVLRPRDVGKRRDLRAGKVRVRSRSVFCLITPKRGD